MKQIKSSLSKGFTLVELLIVVIILALLAAIVVPQFASSTDDAKVASLDTTLANVRSALDLYYQQHGAYPSANAATTTACTAGTAGTGAADSNAAFFEQLSYYTNAAGEACTQKNGNAFPFGPYLKKGELPNNPISNIDTLVIVTAGDLNLAPAAGTIGGWLFDNDAGKFVANIRDPSLQDPDGNDYYLR